MKSSLLIKILLVFFFLFSLFLHFSRVDTSPKAVLVDEAALGYNAYAIANTGKDEFGTSYPLLFKSFGDQKLPLYIYASVIPVKIFGLNIWSIRFIAALSMSLLVIVIFFLLRTLNFDEWASLVGSGITAVSSWTFILGRFGWESSLGLLMFSLSLLFLLKSMKENKRIYLICGAIFLGLTWYSYIPYRIIALFAFILFFFVSRIQFSKKIIFIILFTIFIMPSIPALISPAGSARFKQTTIIYDQVNALFVNDRRVFCNEFGQQKLCFLIINKPIEIVYTALKSFVQILSTDYLFVTAASDGDLVNIGKFALLPVFMGPLYLLGFVALYIKRKQFRENRSLIFLTLLFAACFLPILITKSPIRIQISSLFPFILIIIIYGYALFTSQFKQSFWKYIVVFLLFAYGILLQFYFINVTTRRNYGNEKFIAKASAYLASQYNKAHAIYVDPGFSDFLIFYAFYNKVSPTFYQKNILISPLDSGGFQHTIGLGKINMYSGEYTTLACQVKKKGEHDLFLINRDLSKDGKNAMPLFTGQEPDQLVYGYIYNLADLCK